MNPSIVTPERFAQGMTFDEYVRYVGAPENLAREAWGGYFPDSRSIPPAHKDRLRGHQQVARPGETEEQRKERDGREFLAMQRSPFFDIWASAGIDEILSALHEKRVLGGGSAS